MSKLINLDSIDKNPKAAHPHTWHVNSLFEKYEEERQERLNEIDRHQRMQALPEFQSNPDGIIYQIVNKETNDFYVGATCRSLVGTFQNYMQVYKGKLGTKLYDNIQKYGPKSFFIKTIQKLTADDDFDERKEYWINYLKPTLNK